MSPVLGCAAVAGRLVTTRASVRLHWPCVGDTGNLAGGDCSCLRPSRQSAPPQELRRKLVQANHLSTLRCSFGRASRFRNAASMPYQSASLPCCLAQPGVQFALVGTFSIDQACRALLRSSWKLHLLKPWIAPSLSSFELLQPSFLFSFTARNIDNHEVLTSFYRCGGVRICWKLLRCLHPLGQ